MTPAKRQVSPQAIQKRGFQEKRDSTEDQGRESIPASEPGSSGDRGGSAGATGDGAACTSGESNNEEPQQGAQQQQATEPTDVQTHCGEPQSHLPSRTSSGAQTPTQSKKRKAPAAALKPGGRPKLPRPEGVAPCPRCNSLETKFCYYNNYNIGQPRYFCKACQRYWTAGGTLRNVPVGAGRRKHKNHASRQQANVGQDGSAQTHLPPQVHLDQYRIAMMEGPLQVSGMPAGMHPAMMPAVGMALPHMASTTLPSSVFVPAETAALGPQHGSSLGPQNGRPGSSLGAGRSSNTLARLGHSNVGSRSLPTKTGNESNSNPSSAENNRSDEGSVHMRRRNMRTKSSNHAERGTGGNSDAGALSQQKGTGSDPLPGSNTPSPPAAPSNGTLSHDSGALIPNSYTSFAFPTAGQQSGDGTSFGTRDGNSSAWTMASSHQHHLHQSIANLQAQASLATLAAPPYGLQTWNPYGMYPSTCFPTAAWGAAAAYRCGVTGTSSPTFNQPTSLALPLPCAHAAPSSLYMQVSQALGSVPLLPMQLYWTPPTAWPTCDTSQPSMAPASLPALDQITRAQINTAASWQVDGGTSIAPQACNTAALPLPVMQGAGKDASGMVASGNGQMFTPWPAAAMPFNSWAPETTSIPPWQQNWGQLPTSSGANSAQPFLMLPTMNTGAGGSGLSGSS